MKRMSEATKRGIHVVCTMCKRRKKPHGRSAPMDWHGCAQGECDGYNEDPKPGCLWPGETDADFGYDCCDHATVRIA